jgi:hypothetical protein
MTEIAVREEEQQNGSAGSHPGAPSPLVQWVYEASQAHQIAVSLSRTSFVPASLRGKPDDITAAILAGQELGLRPMAMLRSLDVIQGTPALRAHAMRGLVQSHGHKLWLVEQTPERVVMRGQRREGQSFGPVQEADWPIGRAAQMGLTDKAEWKKQPQTMLTARATGEICRLIAADVLFAMPYAAEELAEPLIGAVEGGRPVGRVTAAEIMGEPATGEDAPPDGVDLETGEITEPAKQPAAEAPKPDRRVLNRVFALLGELGYASDDRAARLTAASKLLRTQVGSFNHLSPFEAEELAKVLQACVDDPDPQGRLSALLDGPPQGTP